MEKKYTPGPWRVFENMFHDNLLVECDMGRWHYSNRHIAAGKDTIIAEVSTSVGNAPGYPHAKKEEFMSNVTLIAAAPELVEAAETVMKWWEEHQYDCDAVSDGEYMEEYNRYDETPDFVLKAEAALKKAGVL